MAIASIVLIILSIILIILIKTIATTQLNYNKFKQQSKGLSILPNWHLLGGHLSSFFFKTNINNQLLNLHAKYGKTFGLMYGSKPVAVSVDLNLIKTIVLDEQQTHINRTQLFMPMREVQVDCVMFAEDDQWRRIRRAIAPAFRKSKFMSANVSQQINRSIQKLIDSMEAKLNSEKEKPFVQVNIDDYSHRYTLDLVLNCFYKQDNLVDFYSQHDQMVETLELGLSGVFSSLLARMVIIFPLLMPLVDWLLLNFHSSGKMRKNIMQFIKRQTKLNLNARKELLLVNRNLNELENFTLKDGTKFTRNMIDSIIDQFHEGKLSKREYFHSTWFLLNAADKSSADAIAFTLYQLAINRDKQEKLVDSVRREGEQSHYLAWVINESLRLMPPGPGGCSRTIKRDLQTAEGLLIPAGTFVITPAYAIHRLTEYWGDDANQFRPERFSNQKSFHPCQFVPFGLGARICPGREFSLHEMKVLLAKLIVRFTFESELKSREGFDAPYMLYISAHEPANIRISRRNL